MKRSWLGISLEGLPTVKDVVSFDFLDLLSVEGLLSCDVTRREGNTRTSTVPIRTYSTPYVPLLHSDRWWWTGGTTLFPEAPR